MRGAWYYTVVIVTAGIFSAIPFAHAAARLGQRRLWRVTVAYAVAGVVVAALTGSSPRDASGTPVGVAADIGTAIALIVIVVACVQLRPLRARVYGSTRPAQPLMASPVPASSGDSAVDAAVAARARRQMARQIATSDPVMARELRIGRPDLPRTYDDGGLVDLNSAPAGLIADSCHLPHDVAEKITSVRASLGSFRELGEVAVYCQLSDGAAQLLNEHGVLLPPTE